MENLKKLKNGETIIVDKKTKLPFIKHNATITINLKLSESIQEAELKSVLKLLFGDRLTKISVY